MGDDIDLNKLPLEERVVHKVWKARVSGYEECTKLFQRIDDEKSSEFSKYLGLLKKFVIDSNAVAQEKGLDAVLAFVEKAHPSISGRVCSDIISGVVTKCFNARPKTKQKGLDICLMYIEVEKQDFVLEEIMKGFENKQPKVVAASINFCTQAIRAFGSKPVGIKPIVKILAKLFDHSDVTVRSEAKALAIEIHQWIRDAIRPPLQNIKPVLLKELEDEWSKAPPSPPAPTRLTRSAQEKQASAPPPSTQEESEVDSGGAVAVVAETIDPYDLIDPVDILSKMPKDFYENLAQTKWTMRKEAVEALEKLTQNPKIEAGQYGELVAALKKVIGKDSNVVVVALAAKCVAGLATGLRKKFQSYASMITSVILEKFKEKKQNVVTALREAIDAVYLTTSLTAMIEDILASLGGKNPSVKEEVCRFLTRVFCKSGPSVLNKALLKQLCPILVKKLDETAVTVRDAAAETLGTMMKLIGEKAIMVYLNDLDNLKQGKVKEFADKAEINALPGSGGAVAAPAAAAPSAAKPAAKPAAKKAPVKAAAKKEEGSKPPQSQARPSSSKGPPKKKAVAGGGGKSGGAKKASSKQSADDDEEPKELEMTQDEVDSKAAELFPPEILQQLENSNWKERLEGVESLGKLIVDMDRKTLPTQVIVRTLGGRKPGWKDSNFQVLKTKFALCATIALMKKPFSKRSAFYVIPVLAEKIGDVKLKTQSKDTLATLAESISLNFVSLKIVKYAAQQKNPKNVAESANWIAENIQDFGFKIDLKQHIPFIKTCLSHTNPAVRTAAISLLGVLHMYVGPNIRMFFDEEKPALLAQIDSELERVKDQKPPAATRGLEEATADDDDDEQGEDQADGGSGNVGAVNLADLVDRVDISDKACALIDEMGDKNWKVRGEALQKLTDLISEAKFITADLGELPAALKTRMGDSNKNLVMTTLNICASIAVAMGKPVLRHTRVIVPGIFSTLADAKVHVRQTSIAALDALYNEVGLAPFFEGELLAGALSTENPNVRTEVLGWLEAKLPSVTHSLPEMPTIIVPLYSCLEDRSAEVRKNAQAVVPLLMMLVGWDVMAKNTGKLKPASKSTVMGVIEKHRAAAPAKPVTAKSAKSSAAKPAPSSSSVDNSSSASSVISEAPPAAAPAPKKTKPGTAAAKTVKGGGATAAAKKKPAAKSSAGDAEGDGGPALIANTSKDKRIKDEKELKVLKWNFTSPRPEFLEQLKEQFTACVSKPMLANLFHADFKFHVQALNTLTECTSSQSTECMQCLDMLLKWITLRFFDTNTTVLVKCLDFLEALFVMLGENNYSMVEHEASSFIPYLVQKVGDPKDIIRQKIRNLFKLISKVYPASKMFGYISDGISSKNAKTRAECLEELGCLVHVHGMNVCQPTPAKALSLVATQIADRDNSVRNAALNTVVEAYNLVGDSVYKFVGKLNEKDMSYLEERIKRAAKSKPAAAPPAAAVKSRPVTAPAAPAEEPVKPAASRIQQSRPVTAPVRQAASKNQSIRKEFSLDYDGIEGDAQTDGTDFDGELVSNDVDDLVKEPVHIPSTASMQTSPQLGANITTPSQALDYIIAQVASSNVDTSTQAVVQIEEVLRHKTQGEVLKHTDQYLIAASLQLRMLFSTHIPGGQVSEESIICLTKCLINSLITLFSCPPLAVCISREVLKDLIQILISGMLDEKLTTLEDGPQVIRSINVLMVNIIENTNPNSALGSFIKLLQDGVGNEMSGTSKFVELIMKCLWKMIRLLPKMLGDIKTEQLLLDINSFLKTHPSSSWKNKSDDTPLRTIKTLIHTLVKLKGNEILDSMDVIEDPESSELVAYLNKTLKSSNRNQKNGSVPQKDEKSQHRSSPNLESQRGSQKLPLKMNDILAEIFKKIGSKENTKQGLEDLYDFKQKYPDAPIQPFLNKTSQFFQSYIERGLKSIETDRKGQEKLSESSSSSRTVITAPSIPTPTAPTTATTSEASSAYLDRLKALRMRRGLEDSEQTGTPPVSNLPMKTEAESTQQEPLCELNIATSVNQFAHTSDEDPSSTSILDLKKRLDKIRMSTRP